MESIFVGNGSDEPIDLVYRVFCEPKVHNAVAIAPTYSMYKVAAEINDVEVREVQLEEDFSLDADKLLAATDANTRLLWLCSPNNPTANSFPTATIERIIREFAGIVVLDEAYIDFAAEPGFLSRLGEFPNLIVLQTLSKAWGMAGLRLGLAFADPLIVATLSNVKYPYNVNGPTQQTVLERLAGRPPRRWPRYSPNADGRRSAATDESRAQTLPVRREFRAGKSRRTAQGLRSADRRRDYRPRPFAHARVRGLPAHHHRHARGEHAAAGGDGPAVNRLSDPVHLPYRSCRISPGNIA